MVQAFLVEVVVEVGQYSTLLVVKAAVWNRVEVEELGHLYLVEGEAVVELNLIMEGVVEVG